MIKYFKKLGIIRIFELGMGLIAICAALIMITGADVFELGGRINLASVPYKEARSGMCVKLEINEILDVYADDSAEKGSYFVVPYPVIEDDGKEKVVLMAVYLPDEYLSEAQQIMIATAKQEKSEVTVELGGTIRGLAGEERQLFDKCVEKTKENYGMTNAETVNVCFVPTQVSVIDWIVTGLSAVVVLWFISMLVYILSNKNQEHVQRFIIENELDAAAFSKEMEDAKKFGKIIVSSNYVAFLMWYRVFVVKREDIDSVIQLQRANSDADGPSSVKENAIVIRLNSGVEYRIVVRPNNLAKVLEAIGKA